MSNQAASKTLVTAEALERLSACSGGREWFAEHFPEGDEYVAVQMALQKDGQRGYSNWLSWKVSELINDTKTAVLAEIGFSDALISELLAETSGNASRLAASGNASRLAASGENSVIACSGLRATFTLGEGGCAAIAYHDGARVRFAVAVVGENVQANRTYKVTEKGDFVEVL